ncbi:hypothetical protein PR003_g28576 [Phytophthora rubi]|uniref:Secreted protein n=1 Tax=Phytophthora rubi TaxID=129364 RepID=A0A6A3HJ23_9STRA|nr:hypothetical protein PR002_g27379 [Phytophthora rubi]KAE9278256.1 hypothetical protein PR003_g28576 [Phytophthora rubi]
MTAETGTRAAATLSLRLEALVLCGGSSCLGGENIVFCPIKASGLFAGGLANSPKATNLGGIHNNTGTPEASSSWINPRLRSPFPFGDNEKSHAILFSHIATTAKCIR